MSWLLKFVRKDNFLSLLIGVITNKNFWSMIKPFLTNKGHIDREEIILKCDNETITESWVLAEMLNSHYINIVEKTSGKKPSHFPRDNNVFWYYTRHRFTCSIVFTLIYGFDDYLVHYLYSYLDNRKHCMRIHNKKGSLQNIISGVPQGYIVGPTLINLFLTIFYCLF